MVWSDSGIVLSSRKHGENLKIVSVFTQDHGRVSAISKVINRNAFSPFSNVSVELIKKNSFDMGFWIKKYEKQNWIYVFSAEMHLLVCQSICMVLDKVLPIGVRFCKLFYLLNFILENINEFSEKEILILYAYFEFILLFESGFGFDLVYCSICGQKENIRFVSPKTGRTASEQCCFLHKDKLFEIPNIWNLWKDKVSYENITNQDIASDDLLNSLDITQHFVSKNILDFQNHFRNVIISKAFGKEEKFSA